MIFVKQVPRADDLIGNKGLQCHFFKIQEFLNDKSWLCVSWQTSIYGQKMRSSISMRIRLEMSP